MNLKYLCLFDFVLVSFADSPVFQDINSVDDGFPPDNTVNEVSSNSIGSK